MRISREQMLMETAHVVAKRGTCGRLAVGAVIARESRPISWGYVGAPSGEPHCEEAGCDLSLPCTRTNHAERNAILFALNHLIDIRGADIYVTDSPCAICADMIVRHGLKRVYFDRSYRDGGGIEVLRENDVEVYQVLANGMIHRIA